MSSYYFAYGSNMNPDRMALRGLSFDQLLAGQIQGLRLAFNKRCAIEPSRAYANVVFDQQDSVEGVLYRLTCASEIFKMDPFEGAPRLYSREIYRVDTEEGPIAAWVYVANKAMLSDNLLPESWYLDHLLAGEEYLSQAYFNKLRATPCTEKALVK